MEDSRIIELFFARDEKAISETHSKYGRYCYSIAYNILAVNEDCEECVNDTLMKAWNAIPPQKPKKLSAFLGRITRNLSLNRFFEKQQIKEVRDRQPPFLMSWLNVCRPVLLRKIFPTTTR